MAVVVVVVLFVILVVVVSDAERCAMSMSTKSQRCKLITSEKDSASPTPLLRQLPPSEYLEKTHP